MLAGEPNVVIKRATSGSRASGSRPLLYSYCYATMLPSNDAPWGRIRGTPIRKNELLGGDLFEGELNRRWGAYSRIYGSYIT